MYAYRHMRSQSKLWLTTNKSPIDFTEKLSWPFVLGNITTNVSQIAGRFYWQIDTINIKQHKKPNILNWKFAISPYLTIFMGNWRTAKIQRRTAVHVKRG